MHEWLIPLRDAVFAQVISADEVVPLYRSANAVSRERLSGTDLDLALSRGEFLMGQALLFEERNQEARLHFLEGMRLAQAVTETSPSALAWLLRAEHLSRLSHIGPWSFTVANGLDVERFANNALSFNSRSAAAQYLVAARWVFAPAAFRNLNRGISMMKAIIENSDMEKDDRFNVYSAIGFAYLQQRNRAAQARPWLERALEIYPTNRFAARLLDGIR